MSEQIFTRKDTKTKQGYYLGFIIVELVVIGYILSLGFRFWLLVIPFILLDIWSNYRCYKRQKKSIYTLFFKEDSLVCEYLSGDTEVVSYANARFSIREKKFEKDKTEIEVKRKQLLKNQLLGRLSIAKWDSIFTIKEAFLQEEVMQVKYRPEGYWSKYGAITADVVITSSALLTAELAEMQGDTVTANNMSDLIMPIHDMKASMQSQDKKKSGQ